MITASCFKPAWWLPGRHAQTIWPEVFRRHIKLELRNERLELPDNDFIDLVWTKPGSGPVIIILHGLEGNINSHYSRGMLKALVNEDYNVVFMHFRGCSGVPNRLNRSYHSGETGDLTFLVKEIKHRYPNKKVAAVGYSLGGNVLLKYLGETGSHTNLDTAVAISVPFDLKICADNLQHGFSRFYQRHLIRKLHTRIRKKYINRQDTPFDMKKLKEWKTFHQFDKNVTAPVHGFKDHDEYYSLCSSRQFIKHIKIPTLIIHSKDDPFTGENAIPDEQDLASSVTFELTKKGGHVGFIQGELPFIPRFWLEQRIPQYLNQQLI